MKRFYVDVNPVHTRNPYVILGGFIAVDGAIPLSVQYVMNPKDRESFEDFIGNFYIERYNRRDKFFMYTWNNPTVIEAVYSWYVTNRNKYFGSFFTTPAVDLASVALHYLGAYRLRMRKFNMGAVATVLGIPYETDEMREPAYRAALMSRIHAAIYQQKPMFMEEGE